MNTNTSVGGVLCLSRQRFSPFCLQTCDSCLRAFLLLTSRFPSALRVGLPPRSSDRRQFWRLGFGSRLRVYPARSSILPHRIEFRFEPIQSPFFTDRRFAFSCSPRSDYAAAVTFRYRPAVSDLTGTLTPLRCASSQSHWDCAFSALNNSRKTGTGGGAGALPPSTMARGLWPLTRGGGS